MSTELAWAAGFFDGDGNTITVQEKKAKTKRIKCQIGQCDPRVLHRFCKAVGVGKVYGPYNKTSVLTKKPYWVWSVECDGKVKEVLDQLWPYLSEPKRQQATDMLRIRQESKL